ncbi:MAG: hypothetical protein NUV78_01945 [Candidatus Zambryskibacteria bacterium]|nr:hypothetical protein [Candidatus Zambryskibacteria bacterium]
MNISSAKEDPPMEKLRELNADVFIVASFGKILPKEHSEMPKFKTLNVHPSLLPVLRGPAPIQGTILGLGNPGVTIIRMDEKMDHGPIVAQEPVEINPFPDHYAIVEEKLGRAGGKLLSTTLSNIGCLTEIPQDHEKATYIKMIKKEDGLIKLTDNPEKNLKKVLTYSNWPGAYILFTTKMGKEIRVVIKNAKIIDGQFIPTRIIPAGKKEMDWQDFLRGNA